MTAPGVFGKLLLLGRALPHGGAALASLFIGSSLAAGVLPVVGIVAVAELVGAIANERSGTAVTAQVALVACVQIGIVTIGHLRHLAGETLGDRLSAWMHDEVMAAVLDPLGVAHLEHPEVADEIERMQELEWDVGPMTQIVATLGRTASQVVSGIGSLALLASFRWWVAALALAAVIITHRQLGADEYRIVESREANAELARRANWFFRFGVQPDAAKEIRVFGLSRWAADNFERRTREFLSDVWALRRLRLRPVGISVTTVAALTGASFWALAAAVASGELNAEGAARYGQALLGSLELGYGSIAVWAIHQGAASLPHVFGLAAHTRGLDAVRSGTGDLPDSPLGEIRFENVEFAYPDQEPVLRGLDLTIIGGQSTALVGINGAGKTTMIKLLAGLYQPARGRITVDGMDLRTVDLPSWRRQLAVLPQQFLRLELSAADNVALGREASEPELQAAAAAAGASAAVAALSGGWQTPLSRAYDGGAELSGGQWQRVALARAMLAIGQGASVLVLDEPTASLDVEAEARFFDEVLETLHGVTVVLVSHRFSTVRRADRIVVLADGQVVEDGTHAELMAARGPYAEMFSLQAGAFRDESS